MGLAGEAKINRLTRGHGDAETRGKCGHTDLATERPGESAGSKAVNAITQSLAE